MGIPGAAAAIAAKGEFAAQDFVSDRAKGEPVARLRGGFAPEQLGSHVRRRAARAGSGNRDSSVARDAAALSAAGIAGSAREARQSEIDDLDRGFRGLRAYEKQISRLEISMNNALLVREVDGITDRAQQREGLGKRQIVAFPQNLAKRLALQVFHHQVRQSTGTRVDSVVGDTHNVGMLESAQCARLDFEALAIPADDGGAAQNQFQREPFFEAGVTHQVNRAHAAVAEAALDPIFSVDQQSARKCELQDTAIGVAFCSGAVIATRADSANLDGGYSLGFLLIGRE
jgi:hypothetical protein